MIAIYKKEGNMNIITQIRLYSPIISRHHSHLIGRRNLGRTNSIDRFFFNQQVFPPGPRSLLSSMITKERSFRSSTEKERRFPFLFLITITALFVLFQKSKASAEGDQPTLEDLDQLEKLAKKLEFTLPSLQDNETTLEYYKRCEEECFKSVFQLCLKQDWWLFNQLDTAILERISDRFGRSLLLAAVQEASDLTVYKLLEKNIAIHRTDPQKNTPLHLAVEVGRSDLVKELSKYYSEKKNVNKETALHVAIRQGQASCVKALLDSAAVETDRCLWNQLSLDPIGLSVATGEKECLDLLVGYGNYPNLKQTIPDIGNLLHLAISQGQFYMLKYLLETHYSETNSLKDQGEAKTGQSPLSLACYLGDLQAIDFLISQKKVDTNGTDHEGKTAAHWAAKGCQADAIELLGYWGVDLERKDLSGKRPEDYLKGKTESKALFTSTRLEHVIRLGTKRSEEKPNFNKRPPDNLVLQGGATKGIAYVGALEALEKQGALKNLKRVAGTSAGAITATLLAVGYTPEEMKKILMEFDFKSLLDPPEKYQDLLNSSLKSAQTKTAEPLLQTLTKELAIGLPPSDPFGFDQLPISPFRTHRFYKELSALEGVCEGEKFRTWMDERIKDKTGIEHCTFGELEHLINSGNQGAKHLHLFASRIDKDHEITRFSTEEKDENGKLLSSDIIISDAVRASMSIPGLFKPHKMHYKRKNQRVSINDAEKYVDGGLIYNFPIDAFDYRKYQENQLPKQAANSKQQNPYTLGICFNTDREKSENKPIDGAKDLLFSIATFYYNAEDLIRRQNKGETDRIIEIPVKGIDLSNWEFTEHEKRALIEVGAQAIENSSKFTVSTVQNNPAKRQLTNLSDNRIHSSFVGRDEFLQELKEQFINKKNHPNDLKIRVLFGLPGMGKTQIALNFARRHRDDFSQIWVIDCRTDPSRDEGYRLIAEKLKIFLPDGICGEEISRRVHRKLENTDNNQKPWLLILDNVEDKIDPKKNLPRNGGCILLTTNRKDVWPIEDQLEQVKAFTEEEAISLLTKVTKEKKSNAMIDLAKILGYFPLALNLAAHHIGSDRTITINSYIQGYNLKKQPLRAPMAAEQYYEYTLQNVWDRSLEKIEKESSIASNWLNVCAHLNPDHIPKEWLGNWLKKQGNENWHTESLNVFNILQNHAIIHTNHKEDAIVIHGLLQCLIRTKQKNHTVFLKETILLVEDSLEKFDEFNRDTWLTSKKGYINALWIIEGGFLANLDLKKQSDILFSLGEAAYTFGNYSKVFEFHKKSLDIRKGLYQDLYHPDIICSLNALGWILDCLDKHDESIACYERSLEISRQLYGEEAHPNVANALNGLGNVNWSLSLEKYDKAIEFHEQSLAMKKQIYGDQPNSSLANSLNNLGNVWIRLERYDKALEFHQKALNIRKELYGDTTNPYIAMSFYNIGVIWDKLSEYNKALEFMKKSLKMRKDLYKDHPHEYTASSLNYLGVIYINLEKPEKALKYLEKSLEMKQQVYGASHREIANTLQNIGKAWESLGNIKKAKEYSKQAYDMYSETLKENHFKTKQAKEQKERLESPWYYALKTIDRFASDPNQYS